MPPAASYTSSSGSSQVLFDYSAGPQAPKDITNMCDVTLYCDSVRGSAVDVSEANIAKVCSESKTGFGLEAARHPSYTQPEEEEDSSSGWSSSTVMGVSLLCVLFGAFWGHIIGLLTFKGHDNLTEARAQAKRDGKPIVGTSAELAPQGAQHAL